MAFELLILLLYTISHLHLGAASENVSFAYSGLQSANLTMDGIAQVKPDGLLQITNDTRDQKGHAFYPQLVKFKNSSNSSTLSFSTYFIFGIIPEVPNKGGHGMAFVISPLKHFTGGETAVYLGLFNDTTTGKSSNHVVAVEFDVVQNRQIVNGTDVVQDMNANHVGININGIKSEIAYPAGYYSSDKGSFQFQNLSLNSGRPMQAWVEYNGIAKQMNVTIAPFRADKPSTPLLSLSYDLSPIIKETMYVGFSGSTGPLITSTSYVMGWSFKMNGIAQGLQYSKLPKAPRFGPKRTSRFLTIGLPWILVVPLSLVIAGIVLYVRRQRKFAELLEDWELEYGPHRFRYKDLYIATKGFKDKELLGAGGFGRVYKGILPKSQMEIAVKRISHESRQGMREFVSEIVTLGRLRHRNLVALLGYCRRKGELLLVYEYMPNGSLDKYLYDKPVYTLNWNQRFGVIKGVASGLLYLHEEWEQVVIHRDIKASNVLLDSQLNGRVGDFGLAKLYDHGTDPQTTHVVGTLGYLAPENTRTSKATTKTDVFSFGAFLLEVVCGKRPIEPQASEDDLILVDEVFSFWYSGNILQAVDPKLGTDYGKDEVELVLKLGLLCSHPEPKARPSMRQVLLYLEGEMLLPDLSSLSMPKCGLIFGGQEGFDSFIRSSSYSTDKTYSNSSIAPSLLSGGR